MVNLEKIKEKARAEGVGIDLILKEYIHFFILEFLFKSGYFSRLVFQGGTALRLVYQGVRYSEDLDFVLTRKNTQFLNSLTKEMKNLVNYLDKLLPFARNIQLKTQKDTVEFKRFNLIMEVETLKSKNKTSIEILNIPSYDNQTMIISRQDIPSFPAITVETPQEILSDKFIALAGRNYLKGRDIWDIYFILNTLKVSLSKEILKMLRKKLKDYHLGLQEFNLKFKSNLRLLKEEGGQVLKEEMDRFLPVSYRRSFEKKYLEILENVVEACESMFEQLSE